MKKYAPLLLLLLLCGCHREPPVPDGPLFDVPSLIGKVQSEVEQQLGASAGAPPTWQKEGATLTAQFSQSGLLTGFTLECDEPQKDEKRDSFLKLGNLKRDDIRYRISFTEAPDKVFYFTGVQVQLPATHEVELRVTGPEVLVKVSANGDEFMTLPPWDNRDKKLQVSIGQQIVLTASLLPQKGKKPAEEPLKLQILVDGRVMKEASNAYTAQCELVL